MLKDRVAILFDELDMNVGEIAAFAKTDITNISRIKSGARIPKQTSKTIEKLANGIIEYCKNKGKTEKLDELINHKDGLRRDELVSFLFPDSKEASAAHSLSMFSNKLDAVMKLCGISNSTLAKRTNIDSSYLSRIRSGKRIPKANSRIYELICREIFDETVLRGKQKNLKKLINSKEAPESPGLFYEFRAWLCDTSISDSNIKSLLELISNIVISTDFSFDASTLDFSYEEKSSYFGANGLQEASIRFLSETINSNAKEVYLYSDRNISWMTEDKAFANKWLYLMFTLISKGIKIKIIHNIDRKIPDMVNAVKSWLPLYMSCCIEPYYTNTKAGNRFTHTLFVCPDVACVKAFNLPDDETPVFDYVKEKAIIEKYESIFSQLLEKSNTLIHAQRGIPDNIEKTVMNNEFENIEISFDDVCVTVSRLSEPRISFIILNQQLGNAIKSYCADYEVRKG